jgi:hypothetical protein
VDDAALAAAPLLAQWGGCIECALGSLDRERSAALRTVHDVSVHRDRIAENYRQITAVHKRCARTIAEQKRTVAELTERVQSMVSTALQQNRPADALNLVDDFPSVSDLGAAYAALMQNDRPELLDHLVACAATALATLPILVHPPPPPPPAIEPPANSVRPSPPPTPPATGHSFPPSMGPSPPPPPATAPPANSMRPSPPPPSPATGHSFPPTARAKHEPLSPSPLVAVAQSANGNLAAAPPPASAGNCVAPPASGPSPPLANGNSAGPPPPPVPSAAPASATAHSAAQRPTERKSAPSVTAGDHKIESGGAQRKTAPSVTTGEHKFVSGGAAKSNERKASAWGAATATQTTLEATLDRLRLDADDREVIELEWLIGQVICQCFAAASRRLNLCWHRLRAAMETPTKPGVGGTDDANNNHEGIPKPLWEALVGQYRREHRKPIPPDADLATCREIARLAQIIVGAGVGSKQTAEAMAALQSFVRKTLLLAWQMRLSAPQLNLYAAAVDMGAAQQIYRAHRASSGRVSSQLVLMIYPAVAADVAPAATDSLFPDRPNIVMKGEAIFR